MTQETELVFTQLEQALQRLKEAVQAPVSTNRFEIDTTIHRFEFTFELFWKALKKKLLDVYGIEVHGPRPVLQAAYMHKLINHEKIWLQMLNDRNMTSHTYKQSLADEIYENIKSYVPLLEAELKHCRQ